MKNLFLFILQVLLIFYNNKQIVLLVVGYRVLRLSKQIYLLFKESITFLSTYIGEG